MDTHSHSAIKYRPDIDGLRAIAVLSVVCFHAFPHLIKGGFVGVDIFFVISGFLISTILIESLEKNTFSFIGFYRKRINRIFPALLVVLITCLVFGWFALLPVEYKQLGSHTAGGASFISNFLLWQNTGYFDNAAETKPLLHLWSLGIEEQFYIFWPLLLWVAWKKQFNLITMMIVIALISFIFNVKGIKVDATATFFSPQTRCWELLLGSILAYLLFYKSNALNEIITKADKWLIKIIYRESLEANGTTSRNMLSILGLLLILYSATKFTKALDFPGVWALIPTIGTVLIILSGTGASVNKHILSRKFMVWVGLISYPLYLWHWPILSFARIMEETAPNRSIRISAVIISIGLAWLTYRFIEKPLRLVQSPKINSFMLAGLMSTVGCFGLSIWLLNGIDFRFKPENAAVQAIIADPLPQVKKYFECSTLIPSLKKFNFDGGCHLTKERAPDIMFIGDSHTQHYKNAIWEQFPSKSVLMVVQTSCLPFSSDYLLQGECKEKHDAILSFLESNQSVKKIYLSGYWAYLMTGEFSKIGANWRRTRSLDAEGSKSFIENGRSFIAKITKANKEVIFLKDIPDLDFNINSCFNTRPLRLYKKQTTGDCGIAFDEYKQRMLAYNNIVKQTIEGFPLLKVYDPVPLFCKGTKCLARDNKLPYYLNGDHLNYYGANIVIKDMLYKTNTQVAIKEK